MRSGVLCTVLVTPSQKEGEGGAGKGTEKGNQIDKITGTPSFRLGKAVPDEILPIPAGNAIWALKEPPGPGTPFLWLS